MTETWRLALWNVWAWLALLHVVYYTNGWCRQRRQLRDARRGSSHFDKTCEHFTRLPQVPAGPAPGAICNAYAIGCQCWQCAARAKRDRARFVEELGTGYPEIDRALSIGPWAVPYAETPEPDQRTFCERYADPGLLDHWP